MSAHVEAAIERYFKGEIAQPRERDALFAHLGACVHCRAKFDAQSAANDALSGRRFAKVDLDAMLPALLEGAAPPRRRLSWVAWLAPALTVCAVLVFFIPQSELTPKGGGLRGPPAIEALCFDTQAQLAAHRTATGGCPAPGFVKLVFAAPETVPVLNLVVLGADGAVRWSADVTTPKPRDVIGDYIELAKGDELRVIAVAGDRSTPLEVARTMAAVMTIRGEP